MFDINHAAFAGRIGKEIEVKFDSTGQARVTNSLAVALGKDKTMWVNFTVWGKNAEMFAKFCVKGKRVHLEGRLENNEYEKDNVKYSGFKMVVEKFHPIDWAEKTEAVEETPVDTSAPKPPPMPAQTRVAARATASTAKVVVEDDVPF